MARLLIADNHHVVRRGLRQIFRTQDEWQIVAEAMDGKEAIVKTVETKPDVAVIAHPLPFMNGLELTRQILLRVPSCEILIFSTRRSEVLLHEYLSAGAQGYILKSDAESSIIAAVQALLRHKPFVSPQISKLASRACGASRDRIAMPLTHRERTVVQVIAEGHSSKSAACALNISVSTVETHRASVMRKLNLSSCVGLVRYAVRNHIVEP